MTVSNNVIFNEYFGDGVETIFTFNFPTYDADWVVVTVDGATPAGSVTVTINIPQASAGGTVEFAIPPVNGSLIRIERVVPLTQMTDYPPYTQFPAQDHEEALDKLTMIAQQQNIAIVNNADDIEDLQNIEIISSDPEMMNVIDPLHTEDITLNFNSNVPLGTVKLDIAGLIPEALIPEIFLEIDGSNWMTGPTRISENIGFFTGANQVDVFPTNSSGSPTGAPFFTFQTGRITSRYSGGLTLFDVRGEDLSYTNSNGSLVLRSSNSSGNQVFETNHDAGGAQLYADEDTFQYTPEVGSMLFSVVPLSITYRSSSGNAVLQASDADFVVRSDEINLQNSAGGQIALLDSTEGVFNTPIRARNHSTNNLEDVVTVGDLAGGGGGDFMSTGVVPMTGNIQMGGNRATGAGDPVDPQDYVTLSFADSTYGGGAFLALDGSTFMTGDTRVSETLALRAQPEQLSVYETDVNGNYINPPIFDVERGILRLSASDGGYYSLTVDIGSLNYRGPAAQTRFRVNDTQLTKYYDDGTDQLIADVDEFVWRGTAFNGARLYATTSWLQYEINSNTVCDFRLNDCLFNAPLQAENHTSGVLENVLTTSDQVYPKLLETDVDVNNSTTFVDVPEFGFSMEPNSIYQVRGLILISETGGGDGGGRITFQGSGAQNTKGYVRWGAAGDSQVFNDSLNGGTLVTVMNNIVVSAGIQAEVSITIENLTGVTNDIDFGFAQAVADAVDSSLLRGSYLEVRRID